MSSDHREQLRNTRLNLPPSYVAVGVYRLFTDKNLYLPVWNKCKHGFIRGSVVGAVWATLTFGVQRKFVELFLMNTPRVTGLSHETVFGYKLPFTITTYATLVLLSSQVTYMLKFFLSRNIRISRERAWDQTVASRGKGPDFWQPYVEEWQVPPKIQKRSKVVGMITTLMEKFLVRKIILAPLALYPFVGTAVAAYFNALGTSQYLHRPYFKEKKMTPKQIEIFVEERKWEYRSFGFAAALLQGLPIIGLLFSVSNRIGAAMWAHDLEKRQHAFASGELKPLPPLTVNQSIELRPLSHAEPSIVGGFDEK